MLSDNRICKIIQINKDDFQSPLLLADDDFLDIKNNKDLYAKRLILGDS